MVTEEEQKEHMIMVRKMNKRIKSIERGLWLVFLFTFVTMLIMLFNGV